MRTLCQQPPLPTEGQFTPPRDGFVSLIGELTAFVSESTITFAEYGEVIGSWQLAMRNSG